MNARPSFEEILPRLADLESEEEDKAAEAEESKEQEEDNASLLKANEYLLEELAQMKAGLEAAHKEKDIVDQMLAP